MCLHTEWSSWSTLGSNPQNEFTPFQKASLLVFLAKQLHYLNNFQLEKKWHYMWSTFGNDDYRTSRPSKLTHNFSYPYILNLLITTQVLRKIYHTCSPFRSDPHNDYNPFFTILHMTAYFEKQMHFIKIITYEKSNRPCNPLLDQVTSATLQ